MDWVSLFWVTLASLVLFRVLADLIADHERHVVFLKKKIKAGSDKSKKPTFSARDFEGFVGKWHSTITIDFEYEINYHDVRVKEGDKRIVYQIASKHLACNGTHEIRR